VVLAGPTIGVAPVSELARRVLVALVGAPLAVLVLWYGDAAMATVISALSAVAAWELFRIARAGGATPIAPLGIVMAAVLPLVVHAQYLGLVRVPFSVPVIALLGTVAVALFIRTPAEKPLAAAAITLFGVAYTGGLLSFVYALRTFDYAVGQAAGTVVVVFPLVLTWATDVGAFFTGRAIGGRKLMPSISPGKTVSGAIGGIVVSVLVAWLYQRYALIPVAQLALRPVALVGMAVFLSVVGQVGDLVESQFKREGNVKDSSHLIPGHGGVLDRLDSLLFTFPVAFMLLRWLALPVPA
jgi:phosphatidate cytidylyltransferase